MKWHVRFYYAEMLHDSTAQESEWIVEAASESEAIAQCTKSGDAWGFSARPIDVERVEALIQGEIKLRGDIRRISTDLVVALRERDALAFEMKVLRSALRQTHSYEIAVVDDSTAVVRQCGARHGAKAVPILNGVPQLDELARELLLDKAPKALASK